MMYTNMYIISNTHKGETARIIADGLHKICVIVYLVNTMCVSFGESLNGHRVMSKKRKKNKIILS